MWIWAWLCSESLGSKFACALLILDSSENAGKLQTCSIWGFYSKLELENKKSEISEKNASDHKKRYYIFTIFEYEPDFARKVSDQN